MFTPVSFCCLVFISNRNLMTSILLWQQMRAATAAVVAQAMPGMNHMRYVTCAVAGAALSLPTSVLQPLPG